MGRMTTGTVCAFSAAVVFAVPCVPVFSIRNLPLSEILFQDKNPTSIRGHVKSLFALKKQRRHRNGCSGQSVRQHFSTGRMNIFNSGSIDKNTTTDMILRTKKFQQLLCSISIKSTLCFDMKISVTMPKAYLAIPHGFSLFFVHA